MSLKINKKQAFLIPFITLTILFIVGSFFLPHNFRGLIFYGVLFAIDWLVWNAFRPILCRSRKQERWLALLHWTPLILLSSIVLFGILIPFPTWHPLLKKCIMLLAFSGVVAQLVAFVFVVIYYLARLIFRKSNLPKSLLYTGLVISSLVFLLFLTSPLSTLSPTITRVTVPVKNLPKQFEGFRIVQLSDLHLDYASPRFIKQSVNMVNAEQPDLIAFTGDMVTFRAAEIAPYLPYLQQLSAHNGIFCVMGNHDYGSYAFEEGSPAYDENLQQLQHYYDLLQWHLLNNDFAYLTRENDTLIIAGTENQSLKKMFQSTGDIQQTLHGVASHLPIILLTHDPIYWVKVLCHLPQPIVLTLSGHTHGMQIGLNTRHCHWSLYQWLMNRYWGGLYEQNGKHLYINVGLGETAYPGRIGLKPEITVLTLKGE